MPDVSKDIITFDTPTMKREGKLEEDSQSRERITVKSRAQQKKGHKSFDIFSKRLEKDSFGKGETCYKTNSQAHPPSQSSSQNPSLTAQSNELFSRVSNPHKKRLALEDFLRRKRESTSEEKKHESRSKITTLRSRKKDETRNATSNAKFTLKALPLQEENSTDLSNAHAVTLAKLRNRKRFQSYDSNASAA